MIIRATQKKMMSKPVTRTSWDEKSPVPRFLPASPGWRKSTARRRTRCRARPRPGAVAALGQCVLGAHRGFICADIEVALVVVPGRYAVPPPQLAADAPVLYVAHPGKVGVLPLLGHELDVAVFHGRDRGLGQFSGVDIPLVGQVGLDDNARAIPAGHLQGVVFTLVQQAQGVHIGDDLLACLEAIQAPVGLGRLVVDRGIIVENVDHGQAVALAHLVVIESRGPA